MLSLVKTLYKHKVSLMSYRYALLIMLLTWHITCFSVITIKNEAAHVIRIQVQDIGCLMVYSTQIMQIASKDEITIQGSGDLSTVAVLDDNDQVITAAVFASGATLSLDEGLRTGKIEFYPHNTESFAFLIDKPWNNGACCFPCYLKTLQCCSCCKECFGCSYSDELSSSYSYQSFRSISREQHPARCQGCLWYKTPDYSQDPTVETSSCDEEIIFTQEKKYNCCQINHIFSCCNK